MVSLARTNIDYHFFFKTYPIFDKSTKKVVKTDVYMKNLTNQHALKRISRRVRYANEKKRNNLSRDPRIFAGIEFVLLFFVL